MLGGSIPFVAEQISLGARRSGPDPTERLGFCCRGFLCSLQAIVFDPARFSFPNVVSGGRHVRNLTGELDECQ